MHFAGPGPVFRTRHEVMPNGIGARVLPFGSVALLLTKLSVPELVLPHRMLIRAGPDERCTGFPVFDPAFKTELGPDRSAEEVDMIGQDDESTDRPCVSLRPSAHDCCDDIRICEDRFSVLCADGHEDDDGLVLSLDYGPMRGMAPAGFPVRIWRRRRHGKENGMG